VYRSLLKTGGVDWLKETQDSKGLYFIWKKSKVRTRWSCRS
jgi:hypothetical protein